MKALSVFLMCSVLLAHGDESPVPLWDVPSLQKSPRTFPAPEVSVEGVQSLYLEGPAYQGKPTKVFAFLGLPKVSGGKKVPGIVLVHGGGGTAFANWVKLWVSRGYAAIAIDHGGHLPLGEVNVWQPNPEGGPNMGSLDQIDQPVTDQWMFHAVADTILAYSLLQSLPEVDANKIGVTGISWGGVVASVVAGLDERPKFVIPVYGTGFLSYDFRDGTLFLDSRFPPEKIRLWRTLWDPANYLEKARAPMLWLTGSNDFAFTLKALQLSYQLTPAPHVLCVKPGMTHGHEGPAQESPEIFAFADSMVKNAPALTKITGQGQTEGAAWATHESKVPIKAALITTADRGRWQDKKWQTHPAEVTTQGRVEAPLPAGTATWFFNLTDERGIMVSTEHVTPDTTP